MNHTGVRSTGCRRQAATSGGSGGTAWHRTGVRRSLDDARDAHPEGDEDKPPASWMVQLLDDCEACGGDLRVTVTLEDVGGAGTGVVAHLDPGGARRLRAALAAALREIGEDPG
jgi:hypothetical protein